MAEDFKAPSDLDLSSLDELFPPQRDFIKAYKWQKVLDAHKSGDRQAFKAAFKDHADFGTSTLPSLTETPKPLHSQIWLKIRVWWYGKGFGNADKIPREVHNYIALHCLPPRAEVEQWSPEKRKEFLASIAYGAFKLGRDKIGDEARDALIKFLFEGTRGKAEPLPIPPPIPPDQRFGEIMLKILAQIREDLDPAFDTTQLFRSAAKLPPLVSDHRDSGNPRD
jgi:hypothetical protein